MFATISLLGYFIVFIILLICRVRVRVRVLMLLQMIFSHNFTSSLSHLTQPFLTNEFACVFLLLLSSSGAGLRFMRSHNLMHRDLKPQNLLLASFEPLVIKIADFGFARVIEGDAMATTLCGSPLYMVTGPFPSLYVFPLVFPFQFIHITFFLL
jgi:serine/threonine protein kinase